MLADLLMLSHDGVTLDRVWIGNQIYWTTLYKSLITQRLVFSVTVFTTLLGNVFQW
jgi:hypothetical protein